MQCHTKLLIAQLLVAPVPYTQFSANDETRQGYYSVETSSTLIFAFQLKEACGRTVILVGASNGVTEIHIHIIGCDIPIIQSEFLNI